MSLVYDSFASKRRVRVRTDGHRSEFKLEARDGILRCSDDKGFELKIKLASVTQRVEDLDLFMIPAALIECRLSNGDAIKCDGYACLESQEIRIDSADHQWFWLSIA